MPIKLLSTRFRLSEKTPSENVCIMLLTFGMHQALALLRVMLLSNRCKRHQSGEETALLISSTNTKTGTSRKWRHTRRSRRHCGACWCDADASNTRDQISPTHSVSDSNSGQDAWRLGKGRLRSIDKPEKDTLAWPRPRDASVKYREAREPHRPALSWTNERPEAWMLLSSHGTCLLLLRLWLHLVQYHSEQSKYCSLELPIRLFICRSPPSPSVQRASNTFSGLREVVGVRFQVVFQGSNQANRNCGRNHAR